MASRELKDSEVEGGAKATVLAKDGIAVIVMAELDKLKEDLLNISSQEILSRAYEYAMKTEIIYPLTVERGTNSCI